MKLVWRWLITAAAVWVAAYVVPGVDIEGGGYARVCGEETGCGMEPDGQQRIFDPFFTTKEAGKGTGLGLSTANGIVRQAGGALRVSSAPGQGSRFEVLLRLERARE